ncbi:MAG: DMT family transporter [Steroidobacteraceae bacterium]
MSPSNSRLTGGLLAAGSAILFACKGVFAKALFLRGVDYQTLTLMRALLALPLFWGLAARQGFRGMDGAPLHKQPADLLWLTGGAGALCYGVGALLDFHALELIDVSMERALLFSYPALVVLFASVRDRRWPGIAVTAAMLLTYAGICLVVGGFDVSAWRENLVGALLVLACAITFAFFFIAGERCIPKLGGLGFTLIAMTGAAGLVLAQFVAVRPLRAIVELDAASWLLLIALAVLCMVVPSLMQAGGIRRIGAVRGAIISTVGPPAAMLLGAGLLHEHPTLWQVLGTALIVVGVLVIGRFETRS